ncbi:MAG: alpha/beta fold hydrolase [Anaerolineae bacterium]|nr:alpha/beta fold hydrolase [Anaerolineae bacterium]
MGLLVIFWLASGMVTSPVLAQGGSVAIDRPGFEPTKCPAEILPGYAIECGAVTVPEDHARPNGESIRLAVAIVHSVSTNPAPDPVLFIAGGPGGRTLDSLSFWLDYMNPLLAKRDLIFFDQRGTGYSEPALVCPEIDPRVTDPLQAYSHVEPIIACRERLESMGIDLDAYNSVQNAADIAALRRALGYERWNLYGVSYGSRVALTVLRNHPQGVRAAILDAITPVEADLLLDDPAYARDALQTLFAACRDDLVCRMAYPDLERVYAETVYTLSADPISLEIVHPKTGESRIELVNGRTFNGFVVGSLAMPETSGVPGLIYEVGSGNLESIVANLESAWESATEEERKAQARGSAARAAVGLQLAVLCNEEAPFVAPAEMDAMLTAYPADIHFFSTFDSALYGACRAWGGGAADPRENEPVGSDIPALVMAGEYDAARSVAAARLAAEKLSNGMVVVFPGAGHSTVLAGACPLAVMGSFLGDPTSTPDTDCIVRMERPQFYPTVSRTRSVARVAAVLSGLGGLSILIAAGIGLGRLSIRRQVAWRVVWRRVGWWPPALNAALSVGLYLVAPAIDLTLFYEHSLSQSIAIVGPLLVAIQAAFLAAPDDEPGLEMLLACPRPFHWLAVERVTIALVGHVLVVLGVMIAGVCLLGEGGLMAMAGWFASVLFLSGTAAWVSIRSHKAMMGVLIALLAWLVLGVTSSYVGDLLIPAVPLAFPSPWPRPFDLIQPLLWMAHPFLRPDSLTMADFWLNRVIVSAVGLGLMGLAMALLADPERLLVGVRDGKRATGYLGKVIARKGREKAGERVAGDPVAVHWPRSLKLKVRQLGAIIHYEWLMGWRRGTLRAILVAIVLFPQLFYAIDYVFGSTGTSLAMDLALWPQAVLFRNTGQAIMANVITIVMIVLVLPLMFAELIPLDRQYRVRELVDAVPVTRGVYLAGKVLSVWSSIAVAMVLSALLNGTLAWIQNGPYRSGVLVAFWATGLIPLALFASAMGVLLSARQPNRYRAVLIGLAVAVASLAACFVLPVNGFVFAALIRDGLTLEQLADPLIRAASPHFPAVFSLETLLRIGGAAAIVVLVWIGTLQAMRRVEYEEE